MIHPLYVLSVVGVRQFFTFSPRNKKGCWEVQEGGAASAAAAIILQSDAISWVRGVPQFTPVPRLLPVVCTIVIPPIRKAAVAPWMPCITTSNSIHLPCFAESVLGPYLCFLPLFTFAPSFQQSSLKSSDIGRTDDGLSLVEHGSICYRCQWTYVVCLDLISKKMTVFLNNFGLVSDLLTVQRWVSDPSSLCWEGSRSPLRASHASLRILPQKDFVLFLCGPWVGLSKIVF